MHAEYTTVARVDEKNLQVDKSLSSFRPTLIFLQHSVYSTFLFFTSDCNIGVLTDTNSLCSLCFFAKTVLCHVVALYYIIYPHH